MGLTLLIGGARSGKSTLAVRAAGAHDGPVTFIATAEPRDEEMASRIAQHREMRPGDWDTVEEPVELAAAIEAAPAGACVIVDCLTLWVANLLERGAHRDEVIARAAEATKAAAGRRAPVLVVTNEVGSGIVPMHPETRAYRDLMGSVNSTFAGDSERVLLVVAGRALALSTVEEVSPDVLGG
jgi:adenosyl cobinamide kinase/adenosyl cobinamide phosphate guanylyltransferase